MSLLKEGGLARYPPRLPLPPGGRSAEASVGILQSSCGLLRAGWGPGAVPPALCTSRVSPTPCRRCSLLPLGQAGKLRHTDGDDVLGSEPELRVPAFSPRSPASCLSWKTLPLDVRFVGRTNTGLELSGSLPVADRSGLDFGHSSLGRPVLELSSSRLSAGSGPGCRV